MADGDIGSVRSTLEFDPVVGTYCRIIKSFDTIATIAAFETGGKEKFSTIEVNPALPYALTLKDTLIYGFGGGSRHKLCERLPGCVLVHYLSHRDAAGVKVQLGSVIVGAGGAMGAALTDNVMTENSAGANPDLIHLLGDVIALVMGDSGGDGWIKTFSCTSVGDIDPTELSSWEFETGVADHTNIIKISNNIVAVVYTDSVFDGWIKTIAIAGNGAITNAFQDFLEFEDTKCVDPRICHVSGNIYAIVYKDTNNDGKIVTVSIDSSGTIPATIEDFFVFETGTFNRPAICRVCDTMVAVAYGGPDDDGFLKTIEIDAAGQITEPVQDTLEFETTLCQNPSICYMQGDIYLIAFTSTGLDGFVVSVDIATPSVAVPHHEMIMKIGP